MVAVSQSVRKMPPPASQRPRRLSLGDSEAMVDAAKRAAQDFGTTAASRPRKDSAASTLSTGSAGSGEAAPATRPRKESSAAEPVTARPRTQSDAKSPEKKPQRPQTAAAVSPESRHVRSPSATLSARKRGHERKVSGFHYANPLPLNPPGTTTAKGVSISARLPKQEQKQEKQQQQLQPQGDEMAAPAAPAAPPSETEEKEKQRQEEVKRAYARLRFGMIHGLVV